jgi:hypothetical protein
VKEMIVKYLNDGVWGYIDNVRQVASRNIDAQEMAQKYDDTCTFAKPEDDVCSYCCGKRLSDGTIMANKAFTMACNATYDFFDDAQSDHAHTENMLNGDRVLENYPASIILLYLNDHKEYDTVILITNQSCFLMNDKGQTIERLV